MIGIAKIPPLSCAAIAFLAAPPSIPTEIDWYHGSFDSAVTRAQDEDKDLLLYFWSERSDACAGFYQGPLQDARVAAATRPFLCVGVQLEPESGKALFNRYAITTTPALLLVDPADQRAQGGVFGSANVPTVVRELRRMADDEGTLRALERATAADPGDLDVRSRLADCVAALGQAEKARHLRESITADDPDGSSDAAASMLLEQHMRRTFGSLAELSADPIRDLVEHVQAIKPPATRQRGWDHVARLRNAIGDRVGEMAAWRQAFPLVRDGRLFNWGWNQCLWWWSNRDVLTKKDKAFALEVARKTAEVSERLSAEDPEYYDPRLFLTRRLNVLAMTQHMNGHPGEAMRVMERCVRLAPDNDEYSARLAAYRAGAADECFQPYSDYDPAWSPDGRKILFTSTRDYNAELYVADVKTGAQRRITRSLAADDQGVFRPTGRFLAFRSDRFLTTGIYRAKLDGSGCSLLVSLRTADGQVVPAGMPSYSRDGRQLAMIAMFDGRSRAALANAAGGLATPILGATQAVATVTWADSRLLYSASQNQQQDLFIADASGAAAHNLTPADDESWDAEASADRRGKRVVFARWRDGDYDLWSVLVDGSQLTQITSGPARDRRPALSPDGKHVAFDRTDASGNSRIWVMRVDGTESRPLLD